MSSYGSISPSDEGFDRYEPPFYCPPSHQGSPMDGGVYWPGVEPEFDSRDVYHDNQHYISRSYGYDDVNMSNDPYDGFQNVHQNYMQNNTGVECELQLPRYPRPAAPSFVRVVKRRSTANKKERRRTQSINTAFTDLRECIPNVPPDTKLSKIKTLRLATSYISYLLKVLETDGEPAGGFRAELHHAPPRRRADTQSTAEKRGNGRTGWPQHVWALELKTEQNLKT
ncbi:neurogenic differentiation factor 1 isoform X2 [Cydia pomonella]|uniref:neurogenic differentiation factor 1 isoform X2 n=1 Tax=Cydia pomonella TaxID=82600 RepID=UPI002ADE67A0|nr:neurogenic differentiation factor 1 isoform X2 [Cydia pomonella]